MPQTQKGLESSIHLFMISFHLFILFFKYRAAPNMFMAGNKTSKTLFYVNCDFYDVTF